MSVMSTGLGDDERRVAAPKPITITIPTACAMSGVGPTKIWQLIKSGKLPVTRALGRVLIHYCCSRRTKPLEKRCQCRPRCALLAKMRAADTETPA
jgi:predicted DNA-binding transcriptional regulator AlpA